MASSAPYLLALDQGTSSSRSIVFNRQGQVVASAQREFTQHFPQPGWVEHDALEIWATQLATAREAISKAGLAASHIAAIGITNQRETTVLWNRKTGQPLHRAIVWQDRRTESRCQTLRQAGQEPRVKALTGLVLDPYFSATKLAWLLDEAPGARAAAERGELAFGTIDSWLLWQLTGGAGGSTASPTSTARAVHATDVSNASRTSLYDIERSAWSEELLALFNIPKPVLPEVLPSSHLFGHAHESLFGAAIPIAGMAGDQQAALFGQACFGPGLAKNTYGTGCFMLTHTGAQAQHSKTGLVSTRAAQSATQPSQYALEGSVFIGGAVVQWLRDGLKAINTSTEVQALAESVPDAGGVLFVPAFAGLGAPYWDANARGAIVGLTRGSTVAHIARAAVESMAYQSAALLGAMSQDLLASGQAPVHELRVDGGACVNDMLMQMQADVLGIPVVRPQCIETTALGAAYLAGLATGVWESPQELTKQWQVQRKFEPQWAREKAQEAMEAWEGAVRRVRVS